MEEKLKLTGKKVIIPINKHVSRYQILSRAEILRPASGSDCTNGGISSVYMDADLLIPENIDRGSFEPIQLLGGLKEIDSASVKENTLVLVKRILSGVPYFHCVPFFERNEATMFGGNFLTYSGNGFRTICQYPIPIHDRIE